MSRSLNKATLIGNLGADPEIRSTSSGTRVATLTEIRAFELIMLGGAGDREQAPRSPGPQVGAESEMSDFSGESLAGEDDLPF
jgi:hypothetical protein